MKSFFKTTASLILIILFLSSFVIVGIIIFVAAWLQTYNAFTREKVVAEVVISEQKEDDLGPYVDVTLTPIKSDYSAFTKIFTSKSDPNPEVLDTTTFKLYGDTVYIGGPILKFEDSLILLNFETAYKLNLIFARYDGDIELEQRRTPDMNSTYEIGDGDKTYRDIAKEMRSDSFKGKIYKVFFDSEPQSKPTGIFVGDKEISGEIVVRNDGFKWNVNE